MRFWVLYIFCLQTLLTLASSLNMVYINRYVYTVGYPLQNTPNTGTFTYAVQALLTPQPQIIFSSSSTVYLPMGFNRGSTNIFINSFLTSANVLRLQAKDTIFIKSNIVASSKNQFYKSFTLAVILILVS